MQFYVHKNNAQAGPFALMDLRARLQSGEFSYDDLAWREGIANWTPLREILGGTLPDATPHAVSQWTPAPQAAAPKAPVVARLITAVVLFAIFFVVIFLAVFILSFMIGGAAAGMQAASQAHAQGFDAGYAVGQKAGIQFRQNWGITIAIGSLVFSLVTAPVAAGLLSFSNLLPWCRKR